MSKLDDCIQTCLDCHKACLQHFSQTCLEKGGDHVEAKHARLMLDCIDICATSADFMTRGSELHAHVCKACSLVCKACADSCEKVGGMDDCVKHCRKCADSCGAMAA